MDEITLKKELCILLCHHLRTKLPNIYKQLCEYCEKNGLIPSGCLSIEDALNQRYSSFSEDHFVAFVNSLRPDDDYPSIFRRITPFQKHVESINIHSIKPYQRLTGHADAIYCMCIDPAGRILATGSDDKQIRIWALPDLKPVHLFTGHENVITNISINPLCTLLISSSHDKTVRIWSLKTGQCLAVLGGFTSDVIHYCAFSPVGSMIAAGCEDGTVQLWTTSDALQGKAPVHVFKAPGKGSVRWISFSPGGEFMCYSSEPNSITIVTLKTLNEIHLLTDHTSVCDLVSFSSHLFSNHGEPGPRLLTVSNEDGFCDTWQLENLAWKRQHIFKNTASIGRKSSKISTTALDCDENLLVVARPSGIFVYQSMTGEMVGHIAECAACNGCVAIAPHPTIARVFFIANKTGEVAIIDACTCRIICQTSLSIDPNLIDAIWSPDGKWIYATDVFGAINVFVVNGQPLPESMFSKENFESPELSHDGIRVFTDHTGQVLAQQPQYLDIRDLGLGFQMLQGPVLQASAAEVRIIQRISSGERLPQPMTEAVSAVVAPPQHIRCTVDPPFNPHGPKPQPPAAPPSADIADQDEEEHGPVEIVSDQEDWVFGKDGDEENEESDPEDRFLNPVVSRNIPEGIWPIWCTYTMCDENIFIPQAGDDIFFFKGEYENELPPEAEFIDCPAVRCVILKAACVQDNPFAINVTIVFPKYNNSKISLVISYPNPKGIVPINRYKCSIVQEKEILPGKEAALLVHESEFNFNIVKCKIIEKTESETHFNNITVQIGDQTKQVSPWEFYSLDGKRIKYLYASLIVMETELEMSRNIEAFCYEEGFQYFQMLSDSDAFKSVPVPMSLMFFKERLESGYYRSFNAIKNDKFILSECVSKCSSGDEDAMKRMDKIIKALTKVLEKGERERNEKIKRIQSERKV